MGSFGSHSPPVLLIFDAQCAYSVPELAWHSYGSLALGRPAILDLPSRLWVMSDRVDTALAFRQVFCQEIGLDSRACGLQRRRLLFFVGARLGERAWRPKKTTK